VRFFVFSLLVFLLFVCFFPSRVIFIVCVLSSVVHCFCLLIYLFCAVIAAVCILADSVIGNWLLMSAHKYIKTVFNYH
jgi:hypothetical protein